MSAKKKTRSKRVMLLQGNEACAMGAIDAGCRFFGGYPITPSTEIAEIAARELPKLDGRFIQMEDELGSICACIGASIGGSKALTATSGPGFSLMQEGIGYACVSETPVVIIDVMRGGPSTGLPTAPAQGDVQQARFGTHGDHEIIVLSASNVCECYYQTVRAFNLAEKYRTPVILLIDEVIAHMRQNVSLPHPDDIEVVNRQIPGVHPDWYSPCDSENQVPILADFGKGYRYHITGLIHDENGFPTSRTDEIDRFNNRIMRKITDNVSDIIDVEFCGCEKGEVIVLSYGSVLLSAQEAVKKAKRKLKAQVGLIKLNSIWPFPDRKLDRLFNRIKDNCNKLIVPEMNRGQVFREIERVNKGRLKLEGIFKNNGELIYPETIYKRIMGGRK